jgi:predicted nucleic acid-binding protein
MKKQGIYLDTSIFSGLFDEEFKEYTEPLFERIKNLEFEIIHSNVTEQALENAPEKIKATTKLLPKLSSE